MSRSNPADRLDLAIRADLIAGDCTAAVAKTIAVYGREVFGFVSAALADRRTGHEVYVRFVESLLRELPRFAWRCRLRTFAYFLACQELRQLHARAGSALVVISIDPERATHALTNRPRRSMVAAIRRSLAPEDRELLVLRFDRGFNWREIALTALGEHASERDIFAKSDEFHRRLSVLRMQIERMTHPASRDRLAQ